MFDSTSIVAFEIGGPVYMDPNTLGPVNVQVLISGGTGAVLLQATLTNLDETDLSLAIWTTIATLTGGTDDNTITSIPGPIRAIRLDGTGLTIGTAAGEVRQSSRV